MLTAEPSAEMVRDSQKQTNLRSRVSGSVLMPGALRRGSP